LYKRSLGINLQNKLFGISCFFVENFSSNNISLFDLHLFTVLTW